MKTTAETTLLFSVRLNRFPCVVRPHVKIRKHLSQSEITAHTRGAITTVQMMNQGETRKNTELVSIDCSTFNFLDMIIKPSLMGRGTAPGYSTINEIPKIIFNKKIFHFFTFEKYLYKNNFNLITIIFTLIILKQQCYPYGYVQTHTHKHNHSLP